MANNFNTIMSSGTGVSIIKIQTHTTTVLKDLAAGSGVTFDTSDNSKISISAGDVAGPSSSVDNSIARYDGTTGKLIQGYISNAPTITDTGQVFIGPSGIPAGSTGTTFNTYTTDLNTNVVLNSFQGSGSINAAGNVQALQFSITDTGTNAVSTITGINGLAIKAAASGSVTTLNGSASSSRLTGGATAVTINGFSAQNRVLVGSSATTSVTYTALANTVTGSIGSAFAFRAAGMKVTNVTTGYGFASDGASDLNYFMGLTGHGLNAPGAYIDCLGSTTANASLRIRSGVAPTSPNDGDIWFDGTDLKMRVGGVTKTFTLV